MSIITLIVTLVVVGIVLYAINVYVPMDSKIKQILNIAVVLFLVLWLLRAFGIIGALRDLRL